MAQVTLYKRTPGKAHPVGVVEAADEIIVRKLQRATSGAAAAWDDANTTSIVIGGGTAQTSLTVGGGAAYTGTTIGKAGVTDSFLGDIGLAAVGTLLWSGRSRITSPADGRLLLTNAAGTGFDYLYFGGTTSSFPMLQRSGAALIATRADGAALVPFSASLLTSFNTAGTVAKFRSDSTTPSVNLSSDNVLAFMDNVDVAIGAVDGGFSRVSANITALGNGTAANATGTLRLTTVQAPAATALSLGAAAATQWQINTSGHLIPTTDNASDIGITATNRVRTGYFGTSVVIGATISIDGSSVQRTSAGTASLFTDALTTTITVGGGAAQTSMTLGKAGQLATFLGSLTVTQNLTVSGTTVTINATNLAVQDPLILLNSGAAVEAFSGVALERGATGDDGLLLWNPTNTRFELGFFDTTGGTTAPSATLASFANLKINDLQLNGSSITAVTSLSVGAVNGSLSLVAGGANIVQVTTNGTQRWNVDSSGHTLWNTDNTLDIGASGATRPRTGYFGTSVIVGSTVTVATGSIAASAGLNISTAAGGMNITAVGGGLALTSPTGSTISFTTGGSQRWRFTDAGHFTTPDANSYDIGSSALQARTGYFGTSAVVGSSTVNITTTSTGGITATGAALTITATAATFTLAATGANIIQLTTNATARWNVDGSGHFLANADDAYDIGASAGNRPRRVYAATEITVGGTNTMGAAHLTATGAQTIQATSATLALRATGANDITLLARGTTTPFSDATDSALSGFTATSIIGALNELKSTGATSAQRVANTYTNNTGGILVQGTGVYITTTASNIAKATAATDVAAAQLIGVVFADISNTASGSVTSEGVQSLAFVASLTLAVGDEVFLSAATPGQFTNVAPSASGNVVLSVGFVKVASTYAGASGDLASIQLVRGAKAVV